ncbi:MAG: bifunctional N(6)-L-threonylcarbamoyladenine synthase/serine/threonine protein kinase [Halobacteriota archaeon]
MRILGIEGTAWAASAALYDTDTDAEAVFIESDPYEPESGGIHPREAAEHMSGAIPAVIDAVLRHAAETAPDGTAGPAIDCVAFSRGPGLGPCLRIAGTAARSAAGALSVPLVGVNHMIAHLEIGRHESGFDSPVCLNASGANAHLLGYHNGRYRVLGETMDTGVGNAIDKFTRHLGWTHPGGPKVEAAAKTGEFIDLPYVVKGMDFSFSGIMSAAKAAVDDGEAIDDVCFSLQEHVFGMLTEVSERALSLTGTDELVLGGGVGQNDRLREMLKAMCAERGASFYAPEPRFLGDNAGMIAVLGAKMYAAGDVISIDESSIDPNFRPDQVPVTWRSDAESVVGDPTGESVRRGAEAIVEPFEAEPDAASASIPTPAIRKRRLPKAYRHPELDASIRRRRTVSEARLTSEARRVGVPTPFVWDVDVPAATITVQSVGDRDLAGELTPDRVRSVGEHLARLHGVGIVHGDPTTRNVRIDAERTYLIDFGLGFHSGHVEDHAMDLHVFKQSLGGTAADPKTLYAAAEDGYREIGDSAVIDRLRTIEGRGRYQPDP